jgi:hypothetical protein
MNLIKIFELKSFIKKNSKNYLFPGNNIMYASGKYLQTLYTRILTQKEK